MFNESINTGPGPDSPAETGGAAPGAGGGPTEAAAGAGNGVCPFQTISGFAISRIRTRPVARNSSGETASRKRETRAELASASEADTSRKVISCTAADRGPAPPRPPNARSVRLRSASRDSFGGSGRVAGSSPGSGGRRAGSVTARPSTASRVSRAPPGSRKSDAVRFFASSAPGIVAAECSTRNSPSVSPPASDHCSAETESAVVSLPVAGGAAAADRQPTSPDRPGAESRRSVRERSHGVRASGFPGAVFPEAAAAGSGGRARAVSWNAPAVSALPRISMCRVAASMTAVSVRAPALISSDSSVPPSGRRFNTASVRVRVCSVARVEPSAKTAPGPPSQRNPPRSENRSASAPPIVTFPPRITRLSQETTGSAAPGGEAGAFAFGSGGVPFFSPAGKIRVGFSSVTAPSLPARSSVREAREVRESARNTGAPVPLGEKTTPRSVTAPPGLHSKPSIRTSAKRASAAFNSGTRVIHRPSPAAASPAAVQKSPLRTRRQPPPRRGLAGRAFGGGAVGMPHP